MATRTLKQFSRLRRKLLSCRQPWDGRSSEMVSIVAPQTVRKRFFSETSQPISDVVALDKFTHFLLSSQKIPLGAMREEQTLDVLDAIDGWLRFGGGFAIDSAERLLERLVVEQACKHSHLVALVDLQRDIVNAWIAEGQSQLAMSRAERALFRFLDILTMSDDKKIDFPIQEYVAIVEWHLRHREDHAARLLLRLASKDNQKWNLNLQDHAASIGPIFEECATRLLATDSTLVPPFLETMTTLKEIYPDIRIPDATDRILLDATTHPRQIPVLSPFEAQLAEKRLLDLLQTADENDKDIIHSLLQKTTAPNSSFTRSLVEYYLKIGDCESASRWIQNSKTPDLVSMLDLVEALLESWKTQTGNPWRADEFLKQITSKIDEKAMVSTKSLNLIIGIWEDSEDPSASRKIVDWYSQLTSLGVQPDPTTIKITVKALSASGVDDPLLLVSNDILRHWDSFTKTDKVDIANSVLEMISFESKTTLPLIDRFRSDELISDKILLQSLLSKVPADAPPSEAMAMIHSFNESKMDLSLYSLAMDKLFKMKKDTRIKMKKDTRNDIQSLFHSAMRQIADNCDSYDSNDISEFLYSVIAMHVHRKMYAGAEDCLRKAEEVLHQRRTTHSPIPLACYKKIIVRNWYTAKTAHKAEESFEKLLKLYHNGYENLQPDCDLYTAYIDARAVRKKDVEKPLEEMIHLYETSGDENSKPRAKVFNTVLLSLAQDKRNAKSLSDKSINLFHRMSHLGVQPDIKTLNLVLKNSIKGKSKDVYKTSTMLKDLMETSNLHPDSHTLHLIIDACGSAPSDHREDALKRCLSSFGEIRKQNLVGTITYGILSKVVYRLVSKGTRADKVGESLLAMCCDDGMLTPEVRGRLKSMMSRAAWEESYVGRLSTDGREPNDWSQNAQSN